MNDEIKKEKARERAKEYYYKNKEKVLARQKEYVKKKYKTDSEYRKKAQIRKKRYIENNKERVMEMQRVAQRKYYAKHKGYKNKYRNIVEKALKCIEKYEIGKYDYTIPPCGIIELKDILNGGGYND